MKTILYWLVFFGCCVNSASAQDKYFRITDGGKYFFFNDASVEQNNFTKGENNYIRPISIRTFFLEARNANLFPESLTYDTFKKMPVAQQQQLLDSLQKGFDWSKYQINMESEKTGSGESVPASDTVYSVQNLTFDKESTTLTGDLVTGSGKMQQFMVYPVAVKNSDSFRWFIEWVEPDLYLKKKGYRNMDLPEQVVYEALKEKGIVLRASGSIAE